MLLEGGGELTGTSREWLDILYLGRLILFNRLSASEPLSKLQLFKSFNLSERRDISSEMNSFSPGKKQDMSEHLLSCLKSSITLSRGILTPALALLASGDRIRSPSSVSTQISWVIILGTLRVSEAELDVPATSIVLLAELIVVFPFDSDLSSDLVLFVLFTVLVDFISLLVVDAFMLSSLFLPSLLIVLVFSLVTSVDSDSNRFTLIVRKLVAASVGAIALLVAVRVSSEIF
uniref:Uncharacterized protein n=1 Tax=Cacopsylla melanoneura TaxID=428564 RepID=A0A8D9A3W2_9HEMI